MTVCEELLASTASAEVASRKKATTTVTGLVIIIIAYSSIFQARNLVLKSNPGESNDWGTTSGGVVR
jgi:hypothetical protein